MDALRTIGRSAARLGRHDIHFYVARPWNTLPRTLACLLFLAATAEYYHQRYRGTLPLWPPLLLVAYPLPSLLPYSAEMKYAFVLIRLICS